MPSCLGGRSRAVYYGAETVIGAQERHLLAKNRHDFGRNAQVFVRGFATASKSPNNGARRARAHAKSSGFDLPLSAAKCAGSAMTVCSYKRVGNQRMHHAVQRQQTPRSGVSARHAAGLTFPVHPADLARPAPLYESPLRSTSFSDF